MHDAASASRAILDSREEIGTMIEAKRHNLTEAKRGAGYFRSGLPYNRLGHGPRPLVIFQGLMFENKPQSGLTIRRLCAQRHG